MRFERLAVTTGALAVCLFLASPVLAQGQQAKAAKGKPGGGGGGGQSCPNAAFPAMLDFQSIIGFGPAIVSSDGNPLSANVNYGGNVASRTETEAPTYFPLPISLIFPTGSGYPDGGEAEPVPIDPHVSTWVFLWDNDDLQALPCQMFDMVVDDPVNSAPRYRMRLTLQWREKDGVPVEWDTQKWDQRWVLRYRPHKPGPEATWVDAVRTDNATWVLTSRDDTDPAHFAHLQKDSTGNRKNKIPAVHTMPVMPIELTIKVNCDLGAKQTCAEPGGGS